MPLDKMLSANRVHCQAQCTSKKRVLETLADLFSSSVPGCNADELFQHFVNRERLGSTGIGNGVAIPHCRFNSTKAAACAVITLIEPIDFDAVDGNPVDIFFAMLVPDDADNAHLQNLAQLAETLQHGDYLAKLRNAESNSLLFEVVAMPFCE